MIGDEKYLAWNKRLAQNIWFRRFWSFWAIYSVFFVLAAGVYLVLFRSQNRLVLAAFIAFVVSRLVLSPLIFYFYKKPRPYQKLNLNLIESILFSRKTELHTSFPSDHALSFASIITVFFFYSPPLAVALMFVALLNGWARVTLGYHYIIDILAGWVIGSAVGIIVFNLFF